MGGGRASGIVILKQTSCLLLKEKGKQFSSSGEHNLAFVVLSAAVALLSSLILPLSDGYVVPIVATPSCLFSIPAKNV
jgi:hypothetical protein